MDSLPLFDQGILTGTSEASSVGVLLERGMQCFRKGWFVEGVTCLALARERLSPDEMDFAAVLDAFIQSHTSYCQAQQALQEASKRFAEADSTQQTQLVALEKLLPTLMEKTSAIAQPLTNSKEHHRFQRLRTPFTNSTGHQSPAELQLLPEDGSALPGLYITCFGRFEVKRFNQTITLCSNRNGQVILRYLIAQSRRCATIDTLLGVLWPEDEPGVAQSKLHIAISALRRSLNDGFNCEPRCGYILCKNRVYQLNPKVVIQTDVDEFMHCYQAGQQLSERRVALYERACSLYTDPFLTEDIYADWSFLLREQLSQTYLVMCTELAGYYLNSKHYEESAKWAMAILKENRCDEAAHRYLMQVYAAQGRRSEALQQYQRCARILREELGVVPLPETTHLFQMMLTNEPSPAHKAKI
jgi:DNA-binding SARP family transcriptional activator